jgi:serine/threonine-protein kinase
MTTPLRGALVTTPVRQDQLPQDLIEAASGRLGVYSLIWAGLWTFGVIMNNVVGPALSPGAPLDDAWPIPGNPVAAGVIALSVGLYLYTRSRACDCQLSLDLGLAYQVVLAFALGLVQQWTPNDRGLSWICVLVLLHPMIVPNTPGKTLAAATIAASMDPVGLWITSLRGVETPHVLRIVWTYLPNYITALLAVVPSIIVAKLGRQVADARELGSYRPGELLATGGMGEIYRASHRMLRRPAAIKLIRRDRIERTGRESAEMLVRRFRREAEAAAALHSPHTIALYDFGTTHDGSFYYVMELLEGMDLESLVERFGPLPEGRVVHLLKQACQSLGEAHAVGLIHRDIKPANLYLCRLGLEPDFVKVLDFGLVKAPPGTEEADVKLTQADIAAGTPAYMAPELATGGEADTRSDLYSLGCVAYWLLTGRLLYDAATPIAMMMAHASGTPVPPSQRAELPISPALEALVLSCLAKDPADRPAHAEDLARRLDALDLEERWTRELAEQWWRTNLPALAFPRASQPQAVLAHG